MNGSLDKVAMTARIMKISNGLHNKQWYHEWNQEQRDAAQKILMNVLEVLDEYHS